MHTLLRTRRCSWIALTTLLTGFLASAAGGQFSPCQPMPEGDELTVGEDVPGQSGSQRWPDVAMFSSGRSIVVWEQLGSLGDDRDRLSVHGRYVGADGEPEGSSFQINTYTVEDQRFPAVAVAPNGFFATVWESDASPGDMEGRSIRARIHRANGKPVGPDFQVNNVTSGHQSNARVAMSNQSIVFVWDSDRSSAGNDTFNLSIQARRFDLNGNPIGGQFQVNTIIDSSQRNPDVAMHSDGRFVIVFDSFRSAGNDNTISVQFRRYAASGAPLSAESQLNTVIGGSQEKPRVAMDGDASFMVTWDSSTSGGNDNLRDSVQARGVRWNGIAASQTEVQVNQVIEGDQFEVNIANVGPREYSIVWRSRATANDSMRIRSLTLEGDLLGNELDVSGAASLAEGVSIGSNGAGDSLVVYKRASVPGIGNGVVGLRYGHPCATGQQFTCTENATTLCLSQDRFRVTVNWRNRQGGTGTGKAVELTSDTGYFWFFNPENVEVVIKVLDACGLNDRIWVFAGGLTNVEVDMEVYDTEADVSRTFSNPLGTPFQPIQDTAAFATCP